MFDPYHKWLGIPPKDQPPHHYRLLGLDLFEDDPDVIANAADQRMSHVRSFQTGTYQAVTQKLLNQLAAARVCLLNTTKRAAYDEALRARLAGKVPPKLPEVLEVLEPIHDDHEEFDFAPTPQRIYRPRKRLQVTPWTVAGVSVVVAVVVLYLVARSTPESKQIANAATSETKAQAVAATAKPKVEPPAVAPAVVAESKTELEAETPPRIETPKPKNETPKSHAEEPKPQQEAKPPQEAPRATVLPLPQTAPAVSRQPTGRRPRVKKVPDRLPVPEAAAVQQARDSIRDRYKSDYHPDISPTAYRAQQESRNQLIKKLIQASKETKDTTERFALLQEAKELAEKSFGFSLTNEVIDLLAVYDVSASRMKADYFCNFLKCVQPSPEGRVDFVEILLPVVEEAIHENNFVDARRLCDSLAKFARDTPVLKEIMTERSKVDRIAADYEVVKEAHATLKADPGNYEAHNTIGEYLCLVQHDCDRGIPYLLGGNDFKLKSLADWDATGTDIPEEQAGLGDAWWDLGVRNRAIQWYELAYPKLTGEEKDAVAERLAEIPLDRSKRIDLLPRVDVNRDRVEGFWVRRGHELSSSPQQNVRVLLPILVDGEYDLDLQFTRWHGDDRVGVILPVGKRQCHVCVSAQGGEYGGLELVMGKRVGDNKATKSPCSLQNNQRYSLRISVRRSSGAIVIDATLEKHPMPGESVQVCHWKGKEESLSLKPDQQLPQNGCFGLLTSGSTLFHSVNLRMASGTARWLPAAIPIRNVEDEDRAERLWELLGLPESERKEAPYKIGIQFNFYELVPCKRLPSQRIIEQCGKPDQAIGIPTPGIPARETKVPWQLWTYGSMKILLDDTGTTRYVTQPEERK